MKKSENSPEGESVPSSSGFMDKLKQFLRPQSPIPLEESTSEYHGDGEGYVIDPVYPYGYEFPRKPPAPPKLEWVVYPFYNYEVFVQPGQSHAFSANAEQRFHPKYLFVTTSGFQIERAKVGNRDQPGMNGVDGDLYQPAAWDVYERLEQLERLKLGWHVAEIGNQITLTVRSRWEVPRPFRAAVMGEQEIYP